MPQGEDSARQGHEAELLVASPHFVCQAQELILSIARLAIPEENSGPKAPTLLGSSLASSTLRLDLASPFQAPKHLRCCS